MIRTIFEFVQQTFFDIGIFEFFESIFRTQMLAEMNPAEFIFGIFVVVCGSLLLVFILKFVFFLIRKLLEVFTYD